MGWSNPPVPWREIERRLSGRAPGVDDAPISRRKKRPASTEEIVRPAHVTPYVELHCHSNFSFLDGASSPDELVVEATRLGLGGLALTDHNGFYGAPLFAEAGAAHAMPTIYGAELSLSAEEHLLVLARGVEGYHRLAGAMTDAHLRGVEKGMPDYDLDELVDRGRGHWVVLTGCRKGGVRRALADAGPRGAAEALDDLVDRFGRDDVVVELTGLGRPGDDEANDVLAGIARDARPPVVATGNVHHATPDKRRLAAAMAAIGARSSIADLAGWLDLSGTAHLRSGEEMAQRFARYPGAVHAPPYSVRSWRSTSTRPLRGCRSRASPTAMTPASWLRVLTESGFSSGTPAAARARGQEAGRRRARDDRPQGLRRLLRDRPRHRRVCPRARASCARAGDRQRARRFASHSASPRSTRSSTVCRSSASSPSTVTTSPISTSTSTPTGVRR